MKYILLALSLFVVRGEEQIYNTLSYDEWKKCKAEDYNKLNNYASDGSSSLQVQSNVIEITLGVDVYDVNASKAYKKSIESVSKSLSAMKAELNNSNLTTFTLCQFSLSPQYEDITENDVTVNQFKNYKASYSLRTRTQELDKLGRLIDIGVKNGLNNIKSLDYYLTPERKREKLNELMVIGIQNAQRKAKILLDAMNLQIIGIESMTLNEQQDYNSNANSYLNNNNFRNNGYSNNADGSTQVFSSKQTLNYQAIINYFITPKKR